MLAIGLAALVATLATWMMTGLGDGVRPAWAAPIQTFGLEIAFTFLAAAIGASVLMPRRAEMTRREREASTSPGLSLLLGALAAAALFQAPSVVAWWRESWALLTEVLGNAPDPLGLSLIPTVILLSLPTLATATLMTFVLASTLGMLVRPGLAFSVLGACAALQAGLVIGERLVLHAVRAVGGALRQAFAASPDADVSPRASEWFARLDAAGADVSEWLVWILGGYLVAVAATELVSPRRARAQKRLRPERGATSPSESERGWGPASIETSGTAEAEPEPEVTTAPSAAVAPRTSPPSSAAKAFDYSNYAVRSRQTLLASVLRRSSEYDIQSIPPMSRARFSFSWKTGVLRREPDGPDLLALRPAERHGLFGARSHLVIDLATGAPFGTLRPSGPEWEILDAGGTLTARVVEEKRRAGFAVYVAKVDEQIVCRFTWGMQGLTAGSAELEVEFLSGSEAGLDRALAMALAPILEHQARMANQRAAR